MPCWSLSVRPGAQFNKAVEVADIPHEKIHRPDGVTRIVDLRGTAVPMVDPADAVGISCRQDDPSSVRAVVISIEDQRLTAIAVDEDGQ